MAKEKYARIGYEQADDGFALYTSTDGENWDLNCLQ